MVRAEVAKFTTYFTLDVSSNRELYREPIRSQ
jgi:hypothetical protein